MKKFLKGLGNFLKRFIPLWIVLGIVACFVAVDYVNYSGYEITLVKAYSLDNPDGDPDKLYFATPDQEENILYDIQVTWFGKPKAGHTIVGITQNGGSVKAARQVSDENGICTFEIATYPQYKSKIQEVDLETLFYEESSAWIIEIQVRETMHTTLHRRPVLND